MPFGHVTSLDGPSTRVGDYPPGTIRCSKCNKTFIRNKKHKCPHCGSKNQNSQA